MKKFLIILLIALGFLFVTPHVEAQLLQEDVVGDTGFLEGLGKQSGYSTNVQKDTIPQRIGGIIKIVLGFVGTIFAGLVIYAGILWMTAGGNEDQVSKSQNIIKSATIGLVLTLAAYSITAFVVGYSVETTVTRQTTAGSVDCGEEAFGNWTWQRSVEFFSDLGKYWSCKVNN